MIYKKNVVEKINEKMFEKCRSETEKDFDNYSIKPYQLTWIIFYQSTLFQTTETPRSVPVENNFQFRRCISKKCKSRTITLSHRRYFQTISQLMSTAICNFLQKNDVHMQCFILLRLQTKPSHNRLLKFLVFDFKYVQWPSSHKKI